MRLVFFLAAVALVAVPLLLKTSVASPPERKRARDLGITIGVLSPGPQNAITDVPGVLVGHRTLAKGQNVRTGVTVVLPHGGNLFQEKVPAAIFVGNGFGKLAGYTQVRELGNIETPIALTNTLSVGAAIEGLVGHTLSQPGNEDVRSVNAVVAEINDGYLNDIRGMHVRPRHVIEAIAKAASGAVREGCVGAGHGARAMGFKSGVGTASRVLPKRHGGYFVGVLAVANFGGSLEVDGVPVGRLLKKTKMPEKEKGSCVFVIATDAPVDARNLKRMAARTMLALGRVGSAASNGSGDYAIAFSTDKKLRVRHGARTSGGAVLENNRMTPLFGAVVESAEEAILNALFMAETTQGRLGRAFEALPLGRLLDVMRGYRKM